MFSSFSFCLPLLSQLLSCSQSTDGKKVWDLWNIHPSQWVHHNEGDVKNIFVCCQKYIWCIHEMKF
jgi:hypothetical protein